MKTLVVPDVVTPEGDGVTLEDAVSLWYASVTRHGLEAYELRTVEALQEQALDFGYWLSIKQAYIVWQLYSSSLCSGWTTYRYGDVKTLIDRGYLEEEQNDDQ